VEPPNSIAVGFTSQAGAAKEVKALVRSVVACEATASVVCCAPLIVPGPKPVIVVATTSPLRTVAPTLVTVELPSTTMLLADLRGQLMSGVPVGVEVTVGVTVGVVGVTVGVIGVSVMVGVPPPGDVTCGVDVSCGRDEDDVGEED